MGRDAGLASLQGEMVESDCGKVLGEGSDWVYPRTEQSEAILYYVNCKGVSRFQIKYF